MVITEPNAFANCRSQMQSYVHRVDMYAECLDDARNAAIKKSNDAVRRFNCKAKGQVCF